MMHRKIAKGELKRIGDFEVTGSGDLLIIDPGYGEDRDNGSHLPNASVGRWSCYVVYDAETGRVERLVVRRQHQRSGTETLRRRLNSTKGWNQAANIPVDSGQVGVYDVANYRTRASVAGLRPSAYYKNMDDRWYAIQCTQTTGRKRVGVSRFGAVSSSGWGDGVYEARYKQSGRGKIDLIEVIFIEPGSPQQEMLTAMVAEAGETPSSAPSLSPVIGSVAAAVDEMFATASPIPADGESAASVVV